MNAFEHIFQREKKNRRKKNQLQTSSLYWKSELISFEVWRMLLARVAPAGASRRRRKVCRAERYMRRVVFWNRSLEDVLLYDSRRFAKASYIVSRACERSRLSERFSASSIFWSALLRLLLNGRAINYVNQKRYQAMKRHIWEIYIRYIR